MKIENTIGEKEIEAYLQQAQVAEKILAEHKQMFDEDKLWEFHNTTKELERKIEQAHQKNRLLSIGIVGDMKAGKSSLLNACLFNGVPRLPKAATAMTAALTKISYAETPSAKIYYYTQEDWAEITSDSQKYDMELAASYQAYVKSQDEIQRKKRLPSKLNNPEVKSCKVFEQEVFRKKVSERLKGAKELTDMAQGRSIMDKLGTVDCIEGDVMEELNNYVGAKGIYTPIVNYVELQINDENIEGIEIIDTPGLNDTVVSRGKATKKFLKYCDVVILLSPCGQFMPAKTMGLMEKSLPSAGVRKVLVVGSKLDDGLLNESGNDLTIQEAYSKSICAYKLQFAESIAQLGDSSASPEFLQQLKKSNPIFVSSMCDSLARKKKNHKPFDEEEQKILDNLSRFKGYDDKYLKSLAGIGQVQKYIEEVSEEKDRIIREKDNNILKNTCNNHILTLEHLQQELISNSQKLEGASEEDLKIKIDKIHFIVGSFRNKVSGAFEAAQITCERKIEKLRPMLSMQQNKYRDIHIEKTSENRDYTERHFFGLTKEHHSYTVTTRTANVADVIANLQQYTGKCQHDIGEEFETIINIQGISRNIKEIVLDAFEKGDIQDYDENEILLPVNNALNRITIPHISIDCSERIDELQTRFKKGYVEGEDIHKLYAIQMKLLNSISNEVEAELLKALQTMSNEFEEQAGSFSDTIEHKLSNELDRLSKQVKDREVYQEKYRQLDGQIAELKKEFRALKV